MWLLWLIIAGFFFIFEMITSGFLVCWLGVGAVISMLLSFFVDNIVLQVIVFTISSIILIFLTKPLVKKIIGNKTIPTNTNGLIGKEGIVIEQIDTINSTGQVKLAGEIWSAKSIEENKIIERDTRVVVKEIIGVKLVVEEINKIN